jgi:hypothetical protein
MYRGTRATSATDIARRFRSGTAIGCLAILDGLAADGAVARVRTNYCERASETPEQEAFVAAFTR